MMHWYDLWGSGSWDIWTVYTGASGYEHRINGSMMDGQIAPH
jgi:hypothetical protein